MSESSPPNRRAVLRLAAGLAATAAVPRRGLAAPAPAPSPAGRRRKRVMMMLWRGETPAEKGFFAYLKAAGADYEFIIRNAGMSISRVEDFIAEARETRPDVIYSWGTEVTYAVLGPYNAVNPKRNITDIPVVFTIVTSPVGSGIIPAMGPSHRNFTGVSQVTAVDIQVNALLAYRQVTRMACVYNPTTRLSALNVRDLRAQCVHRGIDLKVVPFLLDAAGQPSVASIPETLSAIAQWEPQFLYLGSDSFIAANSAAITSTALQLHLPTFCATEVPLRRGDALCGLVGPYEAVGRLTAHKVLQVLRDGIDPGRIPVETLHHFTYLVNMKVAEQLGLYPPLAVIDYAELLQ